MSYLKRIVESTRLRIEEAQSKVTQEGLEQRLAAVEPARDFRGSLAGPEVSVIAEIKRASPSKGDFDVNLGASTTAAAYARAGAAAISVLTEPEFFKGRLDDIDAARPAGPPILRKDFVFDEFQVMESRAAGADAVLLIVRILEPGRLESLLQASRALGLGTLVEVHDEDDLERALAAGADVVGVNHRDLETFEVDPTRTAKLAPRVPEEVVLVGLSGVRTRADVEALGEVGARAALVGEALVTDPDPEALLRSLIGAP